MSFTTSLTVQFIREVPIPSLAPPIAARTSRVFTIIDEDGGYDGESPIEAISVSASLRDTTLSSSDFTFSRDFSEFFEATKADFVVATIQAAPDAGFLFRSTKLKANPAPRNGGTVRISVAQGRAERSLSSLQATVSSLLPWTLSGLPPGFTGTATAATVGERSGLIEVVITGSVGPVPPPLGSPPTAPPVNFTLTTLLAIRPSTNLNQLKPLVIVRYEDRPTVVFAGGDGWGLAASILNAFSADIAGAMAAEVASLAQQLVDQIINGSLSGVSLGNVLLSDITASVQRVMISSQGITADAAVGAFVEVPARREASGSAVTRISSAIRAIVGFGTGTVRIKPSEQPDWRWCRNCQGLFFKRPGSAGKCPAGGEHSEAGSYKYRLVYGYSSLANGQENWRWCRKCEGLFYAGNANAGVCPGGGAHDASGSWHYSLEMNAPAAPGQRNWKWCNKCQGLFYSGNPSQGACKAGGSHNSSESGDYAVRHS